MILFCRPNAERRAAGEELVLLVSVFDYLRKFVLDLGVVGLRVFRLTVVRSQQNNELSGLPETHFIASGVLSEGGTQASAG